jgi:hypothetical protein
MMGQLKEEDRKIWIVSFKKVGRSQARAMMRRSGRIDKVIAAGSGPRPTNFDARC